MNFVYFSWYVSTLSEHPGKHPDTSEVLNQVKLLEVQASGWKGVGYDL